jgi:hypothetical protein
VTALDRSEPRTAAFRDALELVPGPGATNKRIVSGDQFEVVPKRSLKGEHVLVLDDTWTTGSRTQSAAPRTPRRRRGSRERDGRRPVALADVRQQCRVHQDTLAARLCPSNLPGDRVATALEPCAIGVRRAARPSRRQTGSGR